MALLVEQAEAELGLGIAGFGEGTPAGERAGVIAAQIGRESGVEIGPRPGRHGQGRRQQEGSDDAGEGDGPTAHGQLARAS